MKKIVLGLFLIITFLAFVDPVKALDLGGGLVDKTANVVGYAPATDKSLASTLGFVVKIALSLTGMVFMALMVYAGYLWMTARGETEPADKAKEIIRGSIIGIILVFAAYSITNFIVPKVLQKTTGQDTSSGYTSPTPEPAGGGTCEVQCLSGSGANFSHTTTSDQCNNNSTPPVGWCYTKGAQSCLGQWDCKWNGVSVGQHLN